MHFAYHWRNITDIGRIYDGPVDDECANAIRNCDVNGPLVMYVPDGAHVR
jgi:hypothetical protein